MIRWWAFMRRLQYGFGFLFVCALIGTGLYYLYGYVPPNCFDTTQNADETGVDCGGACARICSFEIIQPTVLWAESFKIIDGQYNAVAYVENRNKEVGTPELTYTMTFSDAQGVITERAGKTVLPPDSVYPIFEGRVMTGSRIPTETSITFGGDIVWLESKLGRRQFSLERRNLENADSKPRLTADVRNTTLDEAVDVEVVATIFDTSGVPLTAARTVLDYFPPESTQSIVFTWPEPIATTLTSCETPTDVVLAVDLSGSMNNDGGAPPEPITSVLTAAHSFVMSLNKNKKLHNQTNDQVSIVTYATGANLVEQLTRENARVADVVSKLIIDPGEERGSTNTGEGLKRTREELSSSRHNPNARKVAILLTDGLATAPDPDPEGYARSEADALKALGVRLYTIGLGAGANDAFLTELASADARYFKAPTTGELQEIYRTISSDICEVGIAAIEVIPKTKTNFPPLR